MDERYLFQKYAMLGGPLGNYYDMSPVQKNESYRAVAQRARRRDGSGGGGGPAGVALLPRLRGGDHAV